MDAIFAAAATPAFRIFAVCVTLLVGWYMNNQGHFLTSPDASKGIISLELAWSATKADKVVRSWNTDELKRTAFNQVALDFIFIAGYTSLLLAVAIASERAANAAGIAWLASVAHLAAFGGLAAGLLDCLENCGLFAMLAGHINDPIAFVTSVCAWTKFALIVLVSAVAVLTFVMV